MRIFDETKTVELTEYDLTKGYLKPDVIETEMPEQTAIQEQYHYEVVRVYASGGKDVKKVIDTEGKPYVAAHVLREEIQVYIPYTQKQMAQREISELKAKLGDTDYKAIKYAEGFITEPDYAPIRAERQAWRERIGELENVISRSEVTSYE